MIIRPTPRIVGNAVVRPTAPTGLPWDGIGGGGGAAAFDPADVASADQLAWYREDYTDDGSGGVNPWVNLWDPGTRDLANGTAAQRPLITASDAAFAGHPSYTFDGTADVLVVSGDVVSWKPLHDGTGGLIGMAYLPTGTGASQALACTAAASAANVGFYIRDVGDTACVRVIVMDGVAPSLVDIQTAPGSVPRDAVCRLLFAIGGGSYWLYVNGEVAAEGTYSDTPSSANSTSSLNVGRTTSAAQWFPGAMAEIVIAKDIANRAGYAAYLETRYG